MYTLEENRVRGTEIAAGVEPFTRQPRRTSVNTSDGRPNIVKTAFKVHINLETEETTYGEVDTVRECLNQVEKEGWESLYRDEKRYLARSVIKRDLEHQDIVSAQRKYREYSLII